MALLTWEGTPHSGVKTAQHAGWEYRLAPTVFHSPPGYSVCRYRIGGGLADAEWFCREHNDRVALEVGKQICEEIAQKDAKPQLAEVETPLEFGPVQQDWVLQIPLMQQSVLFAAIRGPDGIRKTHPVKSLMRYYRRCVLLSAFDRRALLDPIERGGGSFTGAFTWDDAMLAFPEHRSDMLRKDGGKPLSFWFDMLPLNYLNYVDELPHHFQLHFMHAAQIVGAHHPCPKASGFWSNFYQMIVDDAHLLPESNSDMNLRLSDNSEAWKAREVRAASTEDTQ